MAKTAGSYIEQLFGGVEGLSELFNISPDRVDLVAFPAIGRKFLLVKANFSNKDWGNISDSDYTVDQLARAVPSAVKDWAQSKAEAEGRDIIKGDLRFAYKDPDGKINVNGTMAAIEDLSRADWLPPEVLSNAREELDSVRKRIQQISVNKEDNRMNDIVKSIEGYIGAIDGSGKNSGVMAQLKEILKNMKNNVQSGSVSADDVSGLLDELNAAFDGGKTISKSFFANWSAKAEQFSSATLKTDGGDGSDNDDSVEKSASDTTEETKSAEPVVESVENASESGVIQTSEVQKAEEPIVAEAEKEVASPVAEEVEKAVVVQSTDVAEEKEDILKSVKAQLAKSQADLESAKEEVKKANEEIQKARDEKMRLEFVSKASSELSKIGKSSTDIADLLIKIRKSGVSQALFDEIYELLKSASEMIDKSGFFDEKGTEASDSSDDPDERLMKSARELVKKGEYPTVEQAYTALLRLDPSALEG